MTALDNWLEHAPQPWALRPDQKWHVFLSYRSVNRPWVIKLHDVLRHLGFEVFFDQYELAASEQLIDRLQTGLGKSASGVLVWSTASEDSDWCSREYQVFEKLAGRDRGFRYVVAKLDKVELPLFADLRLYIDFSDFSEGPGGSGLLRLLHGLKGEPLPDGAVRLALQVDEEAKHFRLEIRGAVDNGNYEKLLELAKSDRLAWLTTPALGCEVADGLTRLRRYDEALEVLEALHERFPNAIRPIQLKGLAFARKGAWQAAQDALDNLYAAGQRDPETVGIYARTWMDRYGESRDKLHLRRSRDLYIEAFERAPDDYYTGVNAASKSVFLDEFDKAEEYANKVEAIVDKKKHEGDYWKTATAAEVQLIKRQYSEAAGLYDAAVVMAPEERGSHESTWGQAQKLMEKLGPSAAEREQIARVFAHLSE